jgi:hypothetical protein
LEILSKGDHPEGSFVGISPSIKLSATSNDANDRNSRDLARVIAQICEARLALDAGLLKGH